jgi:basic membrane protein A
VLSIVDAQTASTTPSLQDFTNPVPRMAIAYDVAGRGTVGFNTLVWEGAKRAATYWEAELHEISAAPDDTDADREQRLSDLAKDRYYPIFAVGSTWAGALAAVAPKFPTTKFVILDDATVDGMNVIGIQFNDEQGAFLVGVAAALTSKTGKVGFIGADRNLAIEKFEAGFAAGVRAADPRATVQVAYLAQSPGDAGSSDPAKARQAALVMYDAGADVIFAAGDAGTGVIEAADERGHWAIGAGSDQYLLASPTVRDAILTSMLKRADAATYAIAMDVAMGVPKDGNNVFGLDRGGVGFSTSGGFVDAIKARLDAFAAKIAKGEILVPTRP